VTLSSAARRRFESHREHLERSEPTLDLNVDERLGRASITGELRVPVGGTVVRSVRIEIRYHGLDPFRLPATYDPAHQFPASPDRHIESDGQFCMWLPQTEPNDFGATDGLALHLERVREFIVLQFMFDARRARNISPAWPGDAWGHGIDGHEEWIREQLDGLPACDLNIFRRDLVRGRRATSPDSPCPCHSGRSFRRCHRPVTERIKRMATKNPAMSAALLRILRDPA
jgi:hypothetical protein